MSPDNFIPKIPIVISDLYLYSVPTPTPGTLYTSPVRRSITQASIDLIIATAQSYGLLTSTTPQPFLCSEPGQGAAVDFALGMVVNGVTHDLYGECSPAYIPNNPSPGSYDAFVAFIAKLNDLAGWPGITLGPAAPWDPDNLSVETALPADADAVWGTDTSQPQTYGNWPLGPYANFGVLNDPADFPSLRCGITIPAQTSQLLPVIQGVGVHESTLFSDTSEARMLAVSPLLPGWQTPTFGADFTINISINHPCD